MAIDAEMRALLALLYEHGELKGAVLRGDGREVLYLEVPGYPQPTTTHRIATARVLKNRGYVAIDEYKDERRFSLTGKGVRLVDAAYDEAAVSTHVATYTVTTGAVGALAAGPGAVATNYGSVAQASPSAGALLSALDDLIARLDAAPAPAAEKQAACEQVAMLKAEVGQAKPDAALIPRLWLAVQVAALGIGLSADINALAPLVLTFVNSLRGG
jgi:hypothetical protein